MSVEQVEILEGIKEKIQSVKDRMREQLNENSRLKQRNDDLQQTVQQKQSMIDELEQKNQQLSLVKSIMADSADANDAKIRINRIVQEIDKCIALFNRSYGDDGRTAFNKGANSRTVLSPENKTAGRREDKEGSQAY